MITSREFHDPEEISETIKTISGLRDTCDQILSDLAAIEPEQNPDPN
jgi:hypothetical protein